MEKSPTAKPARKLYWAIVRMQDIIFQGTFAACWKQLSVLYPLMTFGQADENGICIRRIN